MRHRQPLTRLAIALTLLTLARGWAAAQSYGPNPQVLVVGPSEFRPLDSSETWSMGPTDRYLYGHGYAFVAPLNLPDGAMITSMCYYAYDPEGSGSLALIEAVKMAPGGLPAGVVSVPGSFVSEAFNIGYGVVCTEPFSYTVHADADLDGLGIAHLAHEVFASSTTNTAIGGVRIVWQRQVSPPPDSPTFADVPSGAFGYQQIEALVAAGITGGCGGGNYCPNSNVTRAQMAVFLAKALGLHWGS